MVNKYRQFAEFLTDKYIILMLLIFPLFISPDGYSNITITKYLFFVILTSIWLLIIIPFAFFSKPQKPKIHVIFALLFAIFAIISSILSEYTAQTIIGASRYSGLVTILLQIAIFLGISSFGKFSEKYLNCLAISASICCIVSIFQLFGSTIFYPSDYTYSDGGVMYIGKFLGTIGNTNILAAFLCTSSVLLATSFVLVGRGVLKITASMLGIFVLIASESSGGLVAVAVALIIAALYFAKIGVLHRGFFTLALLILPVVFAMIFLNMTLFAILGIAVIAVFALISYLLKHKIPTKNHFKYLVIIIISVVLLTFIALLTLPFTEGTFYEISQVLKGNISPSFGSSRILIWKESLALFPEAPFFGGGPDTLVLRLSIDFSRYSEELGSTLHSYVDNPHNVYISYLINLGIFALISYLALTVTTIIRAIKSKNFHIVMLMIAIVSFWTEEFFGLGLAIVSPMMWILWGLIFSDLDSKKTNN